VRIVLVTTGSTGDFKPFIALARGLQREGYRVRLAGPVNAYSACERMGVEFTAIDQDHQERLSSAPNVAPLEAGNTLRFGLQRIHAKQRIFFEVNQAAWRACQGAEAIVYRIGGFLAVDSIAERLETPCFKAGLVPYTPTREFPSLHTYRGFDFGKAGNRLSYILAEQMIWQFFREPINAFRKNELGLAPYPLTGPNRAHFTARLPVLYGFSPILLPRPCDWPAHVQITGSWTFDEIQGWQPPPGLEEFIESGPPPVYVGFGSMVSQNPQETYNLIIEALRLCGQRAVVANGWGGGGSGCLPSDPIYLINNAPHEWLLPRMAAAVHHGGVGTTMANLRAGIPAIVVPFNYDQPFWASRVFRLGAGPAPLPRKRLTAMRLAQAIQTSLEEGEIRQKAAAIGRQMRGEDGISLAIMLTRGIMQ
jgi:sterol 3beta-glucosyltransferase